MKFDGGVTRAICTNYVDGKEGIKNGADQTHHYIEADSCMTSTPRWSSSKVPIICVSAICSDTKRGVNILHNVVVVI